MIKIEVTGNSIPEVADKLLAIGASLRGNAGVWWEATDAPHKLAERLSAQLKAEVAEAAPTPKPKASSTKSSTPVEITSNGQPSDQNVSEEAKSSDLSSPTTAPKSAPVAEVTESQPTTEQPSSTPAPAISASEDEELEVVDLPITLDFETVVRPLVLKVVDKRGKPFMEAILSTFGVAKASMIKPALLPKLVGLCHEALA